MGGNEARPMAATFWHRKNPEKDACNGLIGQAWTIEALTMAAGATDVVDRRQVSRLVGLVKSRLSDGGSVGTLGLSYKPDTDVIEESQGVAPARALLDEGVRTIVHDAAAMDNA